MSNEELQPEMLAKFKLRDAVLRYFLEPQGNRNMHLDPSFEGFENTEVREMLHSLNEAGLVWKIRGTGPGSIYGTTQDGKILLEAVEGKPIIGEFLDEAREAAERRGIPFVNPNCRP